MNKVDAIAAILEADGVKRPSTTQARRVMRACKVLGIEQSWLVFHMIGFCDNEFEPYGAPHSIERVWPKPVEKT